MIDCRHIALLLLCLAFGSVAIADKPSLLRNGEFEQAGLRGLAKAWSDNSGWADVHVSYLLEREGMRGGLAQRIVARDFKTGAVQIVQAGINIAKGRRYGVHLWMKGDVSAPVEILLRKHGRPYTTYASKAFRVTPEWRRYEFIAAPVADDPRAYFMVRFSGSGTLWLDDAAMVDVSDKVAREKAIDRGNLLPNGSFEVGLDRWGVTIREAGGLEYEMAVALSDPRPAIDEGHARDGRRALRIDLPDHARMILTSSYVTVSPGHPYTLSFWAAAEGPKRLRAGLGAGYFGQNAGEFRTFNLERSWRRYSFTAVLPPAPQNGYYVILKTEGRGRVWLDGFQLAPGKETPFRPHSLAEIGIARQGVPTLYTTGDQIHLPINVIRHNGAGALQVSVRSVDYGGKVRDLLTREIQRTADQLQVLVVSHPSDQPGYFRVVADVRANGRSLDTSEMAIGILPGPPPPSRLDSPFGTHVRFNEASLDAARRLGVSWVRMHPPLGTKWRVVEKDKGRYVFSDKAVRLAHSKGFHILGLLDTTPQWASTAPEEDASRYWAYPPKNINDWARYVYTTVKHFKGVIDYWEVWNEPAADNFLRLKGALADTRKPRVYAALLKVAYREAKRANADAVIVGGCATGQSPVHWTEKILREGAFNYIDIFSFHHYTDDGRPGDVLDVPISINIQGLRDLMHRYGEGEKPIWNTEGGIRYPATAYRNILQLVAGFPVAGHEAAAYAVRNYVDLLANGVAKWFWYHMSVPSRVDRSDEAGIYEWDGSPRPLAVAYGVLSRFLDSAEFVRSIEPASGTTGAEFKAGARRVDIIWAKQWGGGSVIEVPISKQADLTRVRAYDLMGRLIRQTPGSKDLKVSASWEPVYVEYTP